MEPLLTKYTFQRIFVQNSLASGARVVGVEWKKVHDDRVLLDNLNARTTAHDTALDPWQFYRMQISYFLQTPSWLKTSFTLCTSNILGILVADSTSFGSIKIWSSDI